MRILTNPGSNLSEELLRRYEIELLPQHLVVDSVAHDTRNAFKQEQVDEWASTAKRWPDTVGTTAAETVAALLAAAKSGEREIVIVTTSRKIVNSYASAERAIRTFKESPAGQGVDVQLIDTGVTDVGALLACVYLGELKRAGRPLAEAAALTQKFCDGAHLFFALKTLDNLIKMGRATALRAFVADVLGVGPVLRLLDGEIKLIAKYKRKYDMVDQLIEQIKLAVPPGKRVWAAIMHTADTGDVTRLRERLRSTYDVVVYTQRPIAAGVYIGCGPGSIGAAVVPVDDLAFVPEVALS